MVVYLGVPKFIDAFNVVGGSLVDLFLVEHPSTGVVCELASEVLCFIGGARSVIVKVGV